MVHHSQEQNLGLKHHERLSIQLLIQLILLSQNMEKILILILILNSLTPARLYLQVNITTHTHAHMRGWHAPCGR